MNIIDRLKKEKKRKSIFDALIKKKDSEKEAENVQEKPDDIEVRELVASDKPTAAEEIVDITDIEEKSIEEKPLREFRTEGLREFDIESLGADSSARLKDEYKRLITSAIDENRYDKAIHFLKELRTKLKEKKK